MTILQFPMARRERHYIDTADVAKLLRVRLKQEFPGIKFSVRSDRYSGGSSIRVRWTDGPKGEAVEAVIKQYEGADFDGMQDLKTYKTMSDEVRQHHPELPDQPLKGGADFIFAERKLTDALRRKVAQSLAAKWGFEVPADDQWYTFRPGTWGESLGQLVYQAIQRPERFALTEQEVAA